MGLSKIETFIVDLPKRRAHNWASKMTTPIGSHLIVKIVDDDGIVGWERHRRSRRGAARICATTARRQKRRLI